MSFLGIDSIKLAAVGTIVAGIAGYILFLQLDRDSLRRDLASAVIEAQTAQQIAEKAQASLILATQSLANLERRQADQRASSAKIKDKINASPNGGPLDPVVLDALDGLRQRNGRPQ